jgi:prophage antirepressor-like protein
MKENAIAPFEGKEIRKIWHDEQWYFSVVDVIGVLTDSSQPSRYWADLKKRSEKESNQSFDFCERLKLIRPDGKSYPTDCANTQGILRILMSVPSPKVEPLKLWLAEQGKRAIDETENPELSYERMAEIYRAKGYDAVWIKERLQSISTRNELTEEWKNRGVKEGQEYSILTATIAKGTFGLTPSEHAQLKGLEKQNLRDHMTRFELILTSLSEEATRFITARDNAQGFHENHDAAVKGGYIGGTAKDNLERQLGVSVVSSKNFLNLKSTNNKPEELPSEDEKG